MPPARQETPSPFGQTRIAQSDLSRWRPYRQIAAFDMRRENRKGVYVAANYPPIRADQLRCRIATRDVAVSVILDQYSAVAVVGERQINAFRIPQTSACGQAHDSSTQHNQNRMNFRGHGERKRQDAYDNECRARERPS